MNLAASDTVEVMQEYVIQWTKCSLTLSLFNSFLVSNRI